MTNFNDLSTSKGIDCPLKLQRLMWPRVKFYDKEIEVVQSVKDSVETLVHAGNKLGKDYVAGYIALSFFLCPQVYFDPTYVRQIEALKSPSNPYPHTVRVVTTSVKQEHLNILWGEIGRYVQSSAAPLMSQDGGPVVVNHQEIRFAREMSAKNPMSYLKGMVSQNVEGLSGHHAAYTLFVADEASGIEDIYYEAAQGWAKRILGFGNPNPCTNWWRRGIQAGNLAAT